MTQKIDSCISDFTSTEILMCKIAVRGVWNTKKHTPKLGLTEWGGMRSYEYVSQEQINTNRRVSLIIRETQVKSDAAHFFFSIL